MARIVWLSNAPWAPTGYGTQTKQVTSRLVKDGHEVGIIANWGLSGAPQTHAGLTVFPQGSHPYSLDVADYYADFWLQGHEGLVIALYDTWPLQEKPDLFSKHRAYYWCPVDHAPTPPKVVEWVRGRGTIAMSRFGQEQLARAGVTSDYIPHAIETDTFKPTPSDIRDVLRVPSDAHLAVINSANIGQAPPRKRFFENLMGWRMFAERHPDTYLYIHTALQHPRGIDLAGLVVTLGLPQDRIRIVDQGAHKGGFVTQEDLAAIYTSASVLLMATAGEGFGIPAIEAQACGCPVIVTDFSAQPELVGAGWSIPFITDWDYFQFSAHALPDIQGIAAALEESYAISKDPEAGEALRAKAVAKGREYDADLIYDRYWRPFLAKALAPEEPRRGMGNAAKRRARKAKAA